MPSLLTPLEVAERLKVSPRTLEDWRQDRTGPRLSFVRVGRRVRYREEDVARLIEENTESPEPEDD